MSEWAEKLDAFLSFNNREILDHSGKISAQLAEQLAVERYQEFDTNRRRRDQQLADEMDIKELEKI